MKHKWKLGTYFGIDVYLHWTFFLLLGWVLFFSGGLIGALFLVALFGSVVAHEYGHALVARSFGIGTHNITLYPIGGIASLRSMPKRPREEIAVALAGPAVNVVIAFFLSLILLVTGLTIGGAGFESVGGFLTAILFANVVLAGFNLIPAFPMDGGRVLRAWLARKRDYVTATDIAAKVGQGFAVVFALIAVAKGMPIFLLLAVFVYLMAGAERRQVRLMERGNGGLRWPFEPVAASPISGARRPHQNDEVIDVEVISSHPRR